MIRFFWCERGRRAAGQALLDAAEEHLRDRGARDVVAFDSDYRYPFYHMGHAYLSDRIDHIHALMGLNGYGRIAGEVYLDWRDFEPPEPCAPGVAVEVSLHWKEGRGTRPGLVVLAHRDGQEVGECVNMSAGEFSRAEEAQDGFLTKWLGVEEEFQGKGLGRRLLQRTLWEMRGAGYRHAAISTSWTNFRAALFYGNCGYRVADWTYALGRRLG